MHLIKLRNDNFAFVRVVFRLIPLKMTAPLILRPTFRFERLFVRDNFFFFLNIRPEITLATRQRKLSRGGEKVFENNDVASHSAAGKPKHLSFTRRIQKLCKTTSLPPFLHKGVSRLFEICKTSCMSSSVQNFR